MKNYSITVVVSIQQCDCCALLYLRYICCCYCQLQARRLQDQVQNCRFFSFNLEYICYFRFAFDFICRQLAVVCICSCVMFFYSYLYYVISEHDLIQRISVKCCFGYLLLMLVRSAVTLFKHGYCYSQSIVIGYTRNFIRTCVNAQRLKFVADDQSAAIVF